MNIKTNDRIDDMPVVHDIKDFDRSSGILLERLIFNNRLVIIIICALLTLVLGFQATKLKLNASFEKTIPHNQKYIKNFLDNKNELRALGNTLRVAVENPQGTIYDVQYLEILKQVSDELFLTHGVERTWLKSIWTPNVRWMEVTQEGFVGGPVMPNDYDESELGVQKLMQNVPRAGIIGSLVADDHKSTMVIVPLLDQDPDTGMPLDYGKLTRHLETDVRQKYEAAGNGKVKIHIIGFAKIVGDLIEGILQVMTFFAFAIAICGSIIFLYTRCVRSTILLICCSSVAVIWQLGLVSALGFDLDPYSILVPFLVFAIGISHGAQKMNGIMQDIGRGTHKLVAARYTFRRLFLAGLTALLADTVGFAVLTIIDIPVIRDLALTASMGVAILIFTNLVLLPVLLSFTGVSAQAAVRSLRAEAEESSGKGIGKLWSGLDRFTGRRWAAPTLCVATALAIGGLIIGSHVKIGDMDPGAPELRPNSRYNLDNAFVSANYRISSDQFAVIVKTPPEGIISYPSLIEADRLSWELQQIPEVHNVYSVADVARLLTAGTYEANPKWLTIARNQKVLDYSTRSAAAYIDPGLFDSEVTVMPVIAYLADHKAETLEQVVAVADDFAQKHSDQDRQFMLAAGSAGIEAATNIVVKQANRTMMLYVYAAVILLCFITFRSWRAVLVAVIPLLLTSILCEVLMVILGIGVKVATLPVIALGVGIGVDYALYLLSVQLVHLRSGLPLAEAYMRAIRFTGKVVALVGCTLSGAVITWAWSPIKFQADMGILLAFMFFYNMIGAIVLIPALSNFLLKEAVFKQKVLKGVDGFSSIS